MGSFSVSMVSRTRANANINVNSIALFPIDRAWNRVQSLRTLTPTISYRKSTNSALRAHSARNRLSINTCSIRNDIPAGFALLRQQRKHVFVSNRKYQNKLRPFESKHFQRDTLTLASIIFYWISSRSHNLFFSPSAKARVAMSWDYGKIIWWNWFPIERHNALQCANRTTFTPVRMPLISAAYLQWNWNKAIANNQKLHFLRIGKSISRSEEEIPRRWPGVTAERRNRIVASFSTRIDAVEPLRLPLIWINGIFQRKLRVECSH